jgi:hypothetical protein
MFPFYELWSNDLTSVLLLLLLVYAQVQYHLATYTVKIVKDTRALRVSATEENNNVLGQMRKDLNTVITRMETHNGSKENLEQRLQTLASAFKELLSAESALLTSKVATLKKRLVSGGFWGDKARQKLQTQMDDASQRNALLENAASMV